MHLDIPTGCLNLGIMQQLKALPAESSFLLSSSITLDQHSNLKVLPLYPVSSLISFLSYLDPILTPPSLKIQTNVCCTEEAGSKMKIWGWVIPDGQEQHPE